jgi:nucleoside-diphosphate-sugar epimerase
MATSGELDAVADQYAGVKVVVLGATGFIGRSVARALCVCGAEVVLVVREAAAAEALFRDLGIVGHVVACDLEETAGVRDLIGREAPRIVFNLAGYGVDPSERDEGPAHRLNAALVGAICDALSAVAPGWDGQRLVHAGSALEYGSAPGSLVESTTPYPTTLYGRSKLEGTRLLQQRCAAARLRGVCARLFTVYGPGELPGRLLPTLMAASRTDEPVRLSAGLQRRDFTYVEDVASGLLRLGVAPAEPGAVVNLATGSLMTVRSFAETAARVLGIAAARLRFGALPTRPEEMRHDEVNVRRLERLTDWRPRLMPPDGIRRAAAAAGLIDRTTAVTTGAGR